MPPKARRVRKPSLPNPPEPVSAPSPDVPLSKPVEASSTPQVGPPDGPSGPMSDGPSAPTALLGDELALLNHAFKSAVAKTIDIVRYQARARGTKAQNHVPRVPYALSSALAREVEKYDEVCDNIEGALLRAYGIIAAEIERRRAAELAAVPSPPAENAVQETAMDQDAEPTAALTPHSPTTALSPRPQTASRPLPPPLNTRLSSESHKKALASAAPRPSAVHLSSLDSQRPTTSSTRHPPLSLDLSATRLFGIHPDSMASPVTLAPKTARPGPGQSSPMLDHAQGMLPPELLAALAASQQQQQLNMEQARNMSMSIPLMSPVHIPPSLSPQLSMQQLQLGGQVQSGQLGMPNLPNMPLLSPAHITSSLPAPGDVNNDTMDLNMDFLNVPSASTETDGGMAQLFHDVLGPGGGDGLSGGVPQNEDGTVDADASIAGLLASFAGSGLPADLAEANAIAVSQASHSDMSMFPQADDNSMFADFTNSVEDMQSEAKQSGAGSEMQPFTIDMEGDDLLAALTKPSPPRPRTAQNPFAFSASNAGDNGLADDPTLMNPELDFSLPDFPDSSGNGGLDFGSLDFSGFNFTPTGGLTGPDQDTSMTHGYRDDDYGDSDMPFDLDELLNSFGPIGGGDGMEEGV